MAASHDESARVEQAPGVGRAGTPEAAGADGSTAPNPTGEPTRRPERVSFATSTGPAPWSGGRESRAGRHSPRRPITPRSTPARTPARPATPRPPLASDPDVLLDADPDAGPDGRRGSDDRRASAGETGLPDSGGGLMDRPVGAAPGVSSSWSATTRGRTWAAPSTAFSRPSPTMPRSWWSTTSRPTGASRHSPRGQCAFVRPKARLGIAARGPWGRAVARVLLFSDAHVDVPPGFRAVARRTSPAGGRRGGAGRQHARRPEAKGYGFRWRDAALNIEWLSRQGADPYPVPISSAASSPSGAMPSRRWAASTPT